MSGLMNELNWPVKHLINLIIRASIVKRLIMDSTTRIRFKYRKKTMDLFIYL
jgi:hypothetical protein